MTTFVTYAQNFEDLMLWRALKGVAEGFYIDVGAGDPDEDSVTRAFYDRGWCGINVEPSPNCYDALKAARPRDVTLRCLAAATTGEASLHHFACTGLSTTSATIAARHVAEGRSTDVITLPAFSLTDIWRQHASGTVHFLKIDVEGAEADVLRGIDFRVLRPWIVLAEATKPGTLVENWFEWDGLLTEADYRFCWFDGLNRFYLAAEHWDALKGAFTVPPNVFDNWVQPRGKQQRTLLERGESASIAALQAADTAYRAMLAAQAEVAELQERLAATRADLAAAEAEVDRLQASLAEQATRWRAENAQHRFDLDARRVAHELAEAALIAMRQSTSWRITAPMRRAVALTRALKYRLRSTGAIAPNPEESPLPQRPVPPARVSSPSTEEERMQERLRARARAG